MPQDENYATPGVSTQIGDLIVLTPNLELLPQVLTMYLTGCARPFSPRLAPCVNSALVAEKALDVPMQGHLFLNPSNGHSFP